MLLNLLQQHYWPPAQPHMAFQHFFAPPAAHTHAPTVCQRSLSVCVSEAQGVQDLLDPPTPSSATSVPPCPLLTTIPDPMVATMPSRIGFQSSEAPPACLLLLPSQYQLYPPSHLNCTLRHLWYPQCT